MTAPLPESAKQAVEQLAGPRYRPAAAQLHQLAEQAVAGHAAIAERVREHAQAVAAEREQQRAAVAAERAAQPSAAGDD